MILRTAAVVGTGLIGTSVALALTRAGVQVHLLDIDAVAARTAASLGAGTSAVPRGPVDLAVLAVPPSLTGPVLAERQRQRLAHSYTDVAGVKRATEREFAKLGVETSTFIGGHPLAGRERSGPLGARADLFQDRTWVLTPSPRTDGETLNRTLSMVSMCGAVPMMMDSALHDRAAALTSHVPHVLAALMAARLVPASDAAVRLAGTGLRDMTRIAAADPGLWADILQQNAADVADVLDLVRADLSQVVGALRDLSQGRDGGALAKDGAALTDMLARGVAGQARLKETQAGAGTGTVTVSVAFADESGILAEILALAAETTGDTTQAAVDYGTDGTGGRVVFPVPPHQASRLAHRMTAEGWAVHVETRRNRSPRPVRRASCDEEPTVVNRPSEVAARG
ncbi:prephenate dehydrogenase [Streptomyces anandii]|uniref:prephenate dehydrogenase n=1 Tax=Streptomyces anandii TaxID=285454 RepID=UPI00198DB715|nr:prephenate dehydrogenase [Streptomyces anandii]GGX81601.1 prephenate dehydrogenase [Streptomyces anandii JCM 4720]